MGKKNKLKLDIGTIYQKEEGGIYYFRYQVRKERKCVSLKTKNQEEAIKKAKELQPIVQATTAEVISAHVKVARNLEKKNRLLALKDAWKVYAEHPNRAFPATRHEEISYGTTFAEFIKYVGPDTQISQITERTTDQYAGYLKTTEISVSTHNRKILRLRKIFSTLSDYYSGNNPFASSNLRRRPREEQGTTARRLAFSKEQEDSILAALDNPRCKVMNKSELKVVFNIGIFTGQRLKDCVLLQWDQIDLQHQRIFVKQFKTEKEVSIPIAEPLLREFERAKRWQINSFVCPNVAARYHSVDDRGKSVGDNFVNIDIMRVIRFAGIETSVAVPGRKRKTTVYGFHSFRHSFASTCAEAGVPKAVVVSILGADSSIIDRFYTHVGEDAQRAAIEAITGATAVKNADTCIRAALDFIEQLPEKSPEILAVQKILQGQ